MERNQGRRMSAVEKLMVVEQQGRQSEATISGERRLHKDFSKDYNKVSV